MLQVKEGDSTVEAGAQFQQMVNVECVQDFTEQPDLNISFYYNGNPTSIKCKLPISINKFIEPTEMTSEVGEQSCDLIYSSKHSLISFHQVFFSRWKNLSQPSQECQKIFKAAGGMENNDATKAKLIGKTGSAIFDLTLLLTFCRLRFPASREHRPQP